MDLIGFNHISTRSYSYFGKAKRATLTREKNPFSQIAERGTKAIMSKDILVLNEDGEEITEENRVTLTTQDVDNEEHQTHPAPFKQQRSGKKGFRIDDILFSVSNNVLRSSSCLSVVSNSPQSSSSSLCSSNSSYTSLDEMSPVLYLHDSDTPPSCNDKEKPRMASPPTMMTRTRSRSLSPTLVHSSSSYGHQCSDG